MMEGAKLELYTDMRGRVENVGVLGGGGKWLVRGGRSGEGVWVESSRVWRVGDGGTCAVELWCRGALEDLELRWRMEMEVWASWEGEGAETEQLLGRYELRLCKNEGARLVFPSVAAGAAKANILCVLSFHATFLDKQEWKLRGSSGGAEDGDVAVTLEGRQFFLPSALLRSSAAGDDAAICRLLDQESAQPGSVLWHSYFHSAIALQELLNFLHLHADAKGPPPLSRRNALLLAPIATQLGLPFLRRRCAYRLLQEPIQLPQKLLLLDQAQMADWIPHLLRRSTDAKLTVQGVVCLLSDSGRRALLSHPSSQSSSQSSREDGEGKLEKEKEVKPEGLCELTEWMELSGPTLAELGGLEEVAELLVRAQETDNVALRRAVAGVVTRLNLPIHFFLLHPRLDHHSHNILREALLFPTPPLVIRAPTITVSNAS